MFKLQNECENIVVNEEYLELEVDVDNRLDLNVANKKSCCVFIKIKRAKSINVSVEVKEKTHCTYLIYNDNMNLQLHPKLKHIRYHHLTILQNHHQPTW